MSARFMSTRGSRRAVAPIVLLTAIALPVLGFLAWLLRPDKHKWEVPHTDAQSLMANRPECPENWATFPLWPDSLIRPLLKGAPKPEEITVTPEDGAVYHPPNGQLPLSREITSIPEFHDCQRFLSLTDKSQFDSLFAIFANSELAGVTNALGWDPVTWQSSNSAMATVDPSGMVTAVVGAGNVTIKATSVANPMVSKSASISLTAGPPPATTSSPIHLGQGSYTMATGEHRQAVAEFGEATSSTVAAATIYNYGPGYAPLGIGPNFNCLYLYFDQGRQLRAKMVAVQTLPSLVNACATAVDPRDAPGKDLAVRRTVVTIPGLSPAQIYPAVARWDWDPTTEKQFIGIMCGPGWCEVGEAPFDPPPPLSVALTASPEERKVLQVKGWHDEQILAARSNEESPLVPSGLFGTVVPSPDLAAASWTMPGPPVWHTAAYIAVRDLTGNDANGSLDSYLNKLNVREVGPGPLTALNKMSYCYGTKSGCQINPDELFEECDRWTERLLFNIHRWWVRLEPPVGDAKVYCVTRRSHPGFAGIPATARWRWILSDDTIWTECVNGCCQTQGGQG